MWDPLRSHLKRTDVVALSLPGFATDVPEGFDAKKESYVDWLVGSLEAIVEPVDLVGHDWGALLVARVASIRPDLIRTWAAGSAPVDATYVWHDTAQIWRTPDVGEQFMAGMQPELMAQALAANGVPEDKATEAAARMDDRMKDCILKLYRSAVNVGEEWEGDLNDRRPALIIWGADDPFVAVEFGERFAKRVGGRFVSFPECGHWWPLQRATEVAELLDGFWTTAG